MWNSVGFENSWGGRGGGDLWAFYLHSLNCCNFVVNGSDLLIQKNFWPCCEHGGAKYQNLEEISYQNFPSCWNENTVKKKTPKRKGDTLETHFSKKKKTVAFGTTGEKESEQKVLQLTTSRNKRKKKLIYTQKKNKPIEESALPKLLELWPHNFK